ncbi:MAG TPA: hypothetical protein VFH45_09090 [Acidimicrobiales bacterium]|nr:hypothetical protein [Acidimicrobiales bacterium]
MDSDVCLMCGEAMSGPSSVTVADQPPEAALVPDFCDLCVAELLPSRRESSQAGALVSSAVGAVGRRLDRRPRRATTPTR